MILWSPDHEPKDWAQDSQVTWSVTPRSWLPVDTLLWDSQLSLTPWSSGRTIITRTLRATACTCSVPHAVGMGCPSWGQEMARPALN